MGVTTITIEWNEVECADRNGDITSYRIRYGPTSTPLNRNVDTISDPNSRTFSVSGLLVRTNYSFEVAAVNGHGVGPYSNYTIVTTPVPSGTYNMLNLLL